MQYNQFLSNGDDLSLNKIFGKMDFIYRLRKVSINQIFVKNHLYLNEIQNYEEDCNIIFVVYMNLKNKET